MSFVPSTPDTREELDSRGYSAGVEAEDSDATPPIHDPFDPERIDVITRNPTVDLMMSRIRNRDLDLQPDFQRHAGIWNPMAKSRLIESLLLRIPLPTFYAAENADGSWAMVDGIQRMTTIAQFIDSQTFGKDPLKLQQLEYLGDQCNGLYFSELPGRLQTRLRETELVVHLIRHGTPEEVKFNIFARINTGGLPLSRQELRHALIPGQAREVLRDWAQSEAYLTATDKRVSIERMIDREMVLRFIAFRVTDATQYAHNDFDAFLREAMKKINNFSPDTLERLRQEFDMAMRCAWEIFDKHAFRKRNPHETWRRFPINKALFEAISVNLAINSRHNDILIKRKEKVEKKFLELMNNTEFQLSISQSTGDPSRVKHRFAALRRLFEEVSR